MSRSDGRGTLAGLRVLSLESRRAAEMAKLIANFGGEAIVAPSMREVPLESNTEAVAFAHSLAAGGFDMAIFLTGVGARALARVVAAVYPVEQFAAALRKIPIVARGPKPVAALKELGVEATVTVPEPNTWRDLLHALDLKSEFLPLKGRRVALQEYGKSNQELIEGLAERGAIVTRVPVYQWALPENVAPLRAAVEAIVHGGVDMVLFTTSVQVIHLMEIAGSMNLVDNLRLGLARAVIGSIGPVTSDELREHGFTPDFEPTHPKMGFLVNAAAERGRELLQKKRS